MQNTEDYLSPVLYRYPNLRLRRLYKRPFAGPALNGFSDDTFTIELSTNI